MTVSEMLKRAEGRTPADSKKKEPFINQEFEEATRTAANGGGSTSKEPVKVATPKGKSQHQTKAGVKSRTVAELLEKEKDFTRTKPYRDIRRDLMAQLERNGTVGEQFRGLVDDYMKMWVIKEKLAADIKERGVLVTAIGPGGREYLKKNDSVDQLPKYNAQMMKLLSEIGIKPEQNPGDDDEL